MKQILRRDRPDDTAVYRNPYRVRRMSKLIALIDEIVAQKGCCNILDVGGEFGYWKYLEDMWQDRPILVTLLNIRPTIVEDSRFTSIKGDACDLNSFDDMSFDLAFSNSVIEHVGTWGQKAKMAHEIRRVAARHFVQTPNFWFPLEPHFRSFFIHWLPRPLRRSLVMRRNFAFHRKAQCISEAYRILDDAELLDYAEMRDLFPDSYIEREKVVGIMTKSLIAVR